MIIIILMTIILVLSDQEKPNYKLLLYIHMMIYAMMTTEINVLITKRMSKTFPKADTEILISDLIIVKRSAWSYLFR